MTKSLLIITTSSGQSFTGRNGIEEANGRQRRTPRRKPCGCHVQTSFTLPLPRKVFQRRTVATGSINPGRILTLGSPGRFNLRCALEHIHDELRQTMTRYVTGTTAACTCAIATTSWFSRIKGRISQLCSLLFDQTKGATNADGRRTRTCYFVQNRVCSHAIPRTAAEDSGNVKINIWALILMVMKPASSTHRQSVLPKDAERCCIRVQSKGQTQQKRIAALYRTIRVRDSPM